LICCALFVCKQGSAFFGALQIENHYLPKHKLGFLLTPASRGCFPSTFATITIHLFLPRLPASFCSCPCPQQADYKTYFDKKNEKGIKKIKKIPAKTEMDMDVALSPCCPNGYCRPPAPCGSATPCTSRSAEKLPPGFQNIKVL